MSLCECGCGQPTIVSPHTDRWHGWVKGEPRRFLAGHNARLMRIVPVVEDRGYETPCWIWRGSRNERGYGRAFGGQAHRVWYERCIGPIAPGLTIDHLCRVRECVNPEHLEPVTHAENTRRGAASREAVCNEGTALWLREARRAVGLSQSALARRLKVSQALVGHWERGHCEPPPHRLDQLRRELAEGYAA